MSNRNQSYNSLLDFHCKLTGGSSIQGLLGAKHALINRLSSCGILSEIIFSFEPTPRVCNDGSLRSYFCGVVAGKDKSNSSVGFPIVIGTIEYLNAQTRRRLIKNHLVFTVRNDSVTSTYECLYESFLGFTSTIIKIVHSRSNWSFICLARCKTKTNNYKRYYITHRGLPRFMVASDHKSSIKASRIVLVDFHHKSNHIGRANTNETVFFDRHPVKQAVRRFFYAQYTGVPYDRMRVAVTPRNDNRLDCVCNILSPKGFLQTSLGGLTQANETKNVTDNTGENRPNFQIIYHARSMGKVPSIIKGSTFLSKAICLLVKGRMANSASTNVAPSAASYRTTDSASNASMQRHANDNRFRSPRTNEGSSMTDHDKLLYSLINISGLIKSADLHLNEIRPPEGHIETMHAVLSSLQVAHDLANSLTEEFERMEPQRKAG